MGMTDEERAALDAAMDRYADGDNSAFAEIYDLVSPLLIARFMRNLRERSRAEDCVQQTLMQVHAARRNYKRGSCAISWIVAIGRNVMIDSLRKTRKELLPMNHDDFEEMIADEIARDSMPDGEAQAKQYAKQAKKAFDDLPESQRTAFELIRGDGLSVAQAAEVLGTTENAVKLRVHRVYEALRGIFK